MMTLGEKLKKVRQERGLTQAQVCGECITRNMLSQLENDLASPSVRTLEHLADALGVSVGWLLETDPVRQWLEQARDLYRAGEYGACFSLLMERADDADDEGVLLLVRSALRVSEDALADGRLPDAERAAAAAAEFSVGGLYTGRAELVRAYSVLARCTMERGEDAEKLLQTLQADCAELGLEERCCLLAVRSALLRDDVEGARNLLSRMAEPKAELVGEWLILRGLLQVQQENWRQAEEQLHRAESAPRLSRLQRRELYHLLEQCCREQEDYRQAYFYAQRQLQLEKNEN